MGLVSQDTLKQLDEDSFGPERVAEHLGFFPELFQFLKESEQVMGRTRPVVAYATAVTVWAFRQSGGQPLRKLPVGLPQVFWERIAQGEAGEHLTECLDVLEPELWRYVQTLIRAAAIKEEWDRREMASASLVYGPVLLASTLAFWPEDKLPELEETLRSHGLGSPDSNALW